MVATPQARVTGYRLTDEWREAGLMKVSISATIAPIYAPSCGADPLPPVHLGEMLLDVDPALDPAAADPLVAQFRYALRRPFGADPCDAPLCPLAFPLSLAPHHWDRYSLLSNF